MTPFEMCPPWEVVDQALCAALLQCMAMPEGLTVSMRYDEAVRLAPWLDAPYAKWLNDVWTPDDVEHETNHETNHETKHETNEVRLCNLVLVALRRLRKTIVVGVWGWDPLWGETETGPGQ